MTRFTGNSFRITPLSILGRNEECENINYITNLINEKSFGSAYIPDSGWIYFQSAKNRERIDKSKKIQSLKLPDDFEVLPATGVMEVLDTSLKNKLPPSIYLELSEKQKYIIKPIDFLFYNYTNLFCLVSTTNSTDVNFAINNFLSNYPFVDRGFTINKYPQNFSIPADLILWLLYIYYEKNKMINSNLIINDICRLDGVLKAPNSLQYSGESTPENIIELKFSIAKKRTFTKIEFILKIKDNIFQFSINTDGCVEFKPSYCAFYEKEEDIHKRNLAKAVEIYKVIIPELKEEYFLDKEWSSHNRNEFINKCATDCNRSLIVE